LLRNVNQPPTEGDTGTLEG